MIRVFIVDDHEIVRTGLRRILGEIPDMTVCGEAAGAEGLIPLLEDEKPDVVILDVHMPGGNNPSLVNRIRLLIPAPGVVVFTMFHEDSHAIAYLRAGAGAYISKSRSSMDLVEAIRKVHGGGRFITPSLAEYLFENQIDINRPPAESLSAGELGVLRALADGKRATEIARETERSVSTVNTFVQRIKTKLGLRTVVEIVQYARDNGLLG
ncbi:MAG: response regulator transcription factor [Deltaproteobacteria bacterium]|nr:response regulator transcription factor [Deltaproteobacteria bacterium]